MSTQVLVLIYLGLGVLWVYWNSSSRTARAVTDDIPLWVNLVGTSIVIALWPIGAVITLAGFLIAALIRSGDTK